MGIKEIFAAGMKEYKRRSELSKVKRTLKLKKKDYSGQLMTLGKKAWASNLDIEKYGALEKLIATTQDRLEDLNKQKSKLEHQKKDTEEKLKKENESFDSQRKEVEASKKEVDTALNEEKKGLKEAQKESDRSNNRLEQIAKEETQLKKKEIDPDVSNEEKSGIRTKLEGFGSERNQLNQKINAADGTIAEKNAKIEPLEQDSDKFQQEIDKIKADQKYKAGELDKAISQFNTDLEECNQTLAKVSKEQDANFVQLGGELAASGNIESTELAPELAPELTSVHGTEQEMADIKAKMQALQDRETEEGTGAFWKMIGLVAAGVVAVVALIFLFSWLLGPKDKEKILAEQVAAAKTPLLRHRQKHPPKPPAPPLRHRPSLELKVHPPKHPRPPTWARP